MTATKRILLTMWEGGGTVPPELSVARALRERGHEVRALADPVLEDEVRAAGLDFAPWTTAPHRTSRDPDSAIFRDWEARTPLGAFARSRDGVVIGPAARYAADTRAELARHPADVVVNSLLLLGAQIGAEAEGVPCAVLSANVLPLPGWGVPPIGPGFQPARGRAGRARDALMGSMTHRLWDRGLATLNAARTANGLPPVRHALDAVTTADRLLLLTSTAFEYPGFAPPANVRITGPRLDDPGWVEPWTPPAGDEPLVLVGLSSTFQDQAATLRRIIAALGELPVRGVVTIGPALPLDEIDAPPNVSVVASAPHSEVLRHAAAVVTHAGHGTVIKALAAGVPVVALPMGRDQDDNAARVVFAGAGERLRPSASTRRIGAAVRTVLGDDRYRSAAGRLAAAIATETATDRTVAEIEALAGTGAGSREPDRRALTGSASSGTD